MEPELFYWVGGALTVAALVVSAIGIKSNNFPPNNGALFGLLALFAFLVVGSTTYAVVNARDEQAKHRAELAHEQEEADAESEEAGETGGEGPITGENVENASEEQEEAGGEDVTDGGPTDPATTDDGTVAMTEYEFGPDSVEVKAGDTITAENEGAVVHNLTIFDGDDELEGTEDVDPGESGDLAVDVDPGTYEMICTIPGHADLGMVGDITVD